MLYWNQNQVTLDCKLENVRPPPNNKQCIEEHSLKSIS